jgi:hypothetical protein
MSFIFVLFMLHLLTVCALYVCLCDYVNICMYLVLLYMYIRQKAPESLCLLLFKNRIQIKFSYLFLSSYRHCLVYFWNQTRNKNICKLNKRSFLQYKSQCMEKVNVKYVMKRLLHEIFHIVPGINSTHISPPVSLSEKHTFLRRYFPCINHVRFTVT